MFIILMLLTSLFQAPTLEAAEATQTRIIGKEIKRISSEKKKVHKLKLSHLKKKLTITVATPIIMLSGYGECKKNGKVPFFVNNHFEPTHVDANFRCDNREKPEAYKNRKIIPICRDGSILSFAQKVLCEELGVKS